MGESTATLRFATPDDVLASSDTRLVDVLDQLLDAGIVLRAEIWLTVADVDLVFLGADLFLASPEAMARSSSRPNEKTKNARCEASA